MSAATPQILDVFVQPDIRRKRITVTVDTSAECTVRLRIDDTAFETTGASGTLLLDIPEFTNWSPKSPVVYSLCCEIAGDAGVLDSATVPFGMRDFTVKERRFHLNRRPLFVKGVAWDCEEGDGADTILERFTLAKEAGFNLIRLRGSDSLADCLSVADSLGLLVYADAIDAGENAADAVAQIVARYRNHPSLVAWGLPRAEDAAADEACGIVRELDPSRMIIVDSGTANVTRSAPFFIQPYQSNRFSFHHLQVHQHAPINRQVESYLQNLGSKTSLTFLSGPGCDDLGDIALFDGGAGDPPQQDVVRAFEHEFRSRELERLFGDVLGLAAASRETAADALGRQIDIARDNAAIAGYCVSQLRDTLRVTGPGLVAVDGKAKPALVRAREAQDPIRAVIHMPYTNLVVRQDAHIKIVLLNEQKLEGRAELSLQVVGPTNQVLWKKKRGLKIPRHGKELWDGTISASGTPGPHRFVVRLLNETGRIAESAVDFFVFESADGYAGEIDILDVDATHGARCRNFVTRLSAQAPLHVIAPGPNTIRAYPDNELGQLLGQVREGATALFFSPPADWNDLADVIDADIRATSRLTAGTVHGTFHYTKLHPVFEGLPARGLMRQQYRNVAAAKAFVESGEEDICGAIAPLFATAEAREDGAVLQGWGNDLLVRKYGQGRLVFTHLQVLEHLESDPVAATLFVNLLKHFARRTVAATGTFPVHQGAVEWMRQERSASVRRWMIVGMFPNLDDAGLDVPFPPEETVDFSATYPGWYEAITWRPWYATKQGDYRVDLQSAFSPVYQSYPRFDFGTGYAYAEFSADARGDVELLIEVQDAMKIWLNGKPAFESRDHLPDGAAKRERAAIFVRQGRNTLLVKVSKVPGPFRFGLDLDCGDSGIVLKWWK